MADDILAAISVQLGLSDDPLKRGLRGSVSSSVTAGTAAGEGFARQFGAKLKSNITGASASSLVHGLQGQLNGVLGSLNIGTVGTGASAGIFAGIVAAGKRAVQSSAEIQRYRDAIRSIEPDASRSEKAVQDLLDLGTRTGGGTDVLEFGTSLADRSGSVSAAVASAEKQLDALAALRTKPEDFKAIQTNLNQIFNRGDKKVEQPDFQQLRDRAPLLFTEVARVLQTDAKEAEKKLRQMTGNEFQSLLEQIGERNKGLAEQNAGKTLPGASNRLQKQIDNLLTPTGKLLERTLTPVVNILGAGASAAAKFNQSAAGMPGLILGIGAALAALKIGKIGLGAAASSFLPSTIAAAQVTVTGGVINVVGGAMPGGAVGTVATGAAAAAGATGVTGAAEAAAATSAAAAGAAAASRASRMRNFMTRSGAAARTFGRNARGPIAGFLLAIAGAYALQELDKRMAPNRKDLGITQSGIGLASPSSGGGNRGTAGHHTMKSLEATTQKTKEQAAAADLKKAADKLSSAANALQDIAGGGEVARRASQLLQMEFAGASLYDAQLGRSAVTGIG